MFNLIRSSINSTSITVEKKDREKTVRELSDFLATLIQRIKPASTAGQPQSKLLRKIKFISHKTNPLNSHNGASNLEKIDSSEELQEFELATDMRTKDIKESKKAIFQKIESADLTDNERIFCKKLINGYLLTPGYKKYQSYFRALWKDHFQGIDLFKIQRFLTEHEKLINTIKLNFEIEYRQFKLNVQFEPTFDTAKELNAKLKAQFPLEPKPSFDPATLQVECSLEQLEFATLEAQRSFNQFINAARSPKQVAYVTRLIQMILCGSEADIRHTLPMNPICFILRETKGKSGPPAQIESNQNHSNGSCSSSSQLKLDHGKDGAKNASSVDQELLMDLQHQVNRFLSTRLPRNLSASIKESTFSLKSCHPNGRTLSGQLDIYLPGWDHPFDSEWERCPIACVEVSCHIPAIGPALSDEQGSPANMVLSNLYVNWAAPRSVRENLVSYLIDPQSEPHRLTHPLTGKHLNGFADQAEALFLTLKRTEDESLTFGNFSEDERVIYKKDLQVAIEEITTNIKCAAFHGLEAEECDEFTPFFEGFIDIFTTSTTLSEFQENLRVLTAKREYNGEFLKRLLSLITTHKKPLETIAQCHHALRNNYQFALETVFQNNQLMRSAFTGEHHPTVDSERGTITCTLSRFRIAKQFFETYYAFLTDFACNKKEEALASHILAILLCGKEAPPYEWFVQNPRCFVIREFADGSLEPVKRAILLNGAASFNHWIFNEIAGQNAQLEEAQFNASFDRAADLFILDAVTRNRYRVAVGRDQFTTRFKDEDDFRKPFYLKEILDRYIEFLRANPDQVQIIRKTPFAIHVKRQLNVARLCAHLSGIEAPASSRKAVQKLNDYLEGVPTDVQDLVLLKLLELMSFINQHMGIIAGSFLQNICGDRGDQNTGYSITYNADPVFNYSIAPPACDIFSCRVNIIFILFNPAMRHTTAQNQTIRIASTQNSPAQMDLTLEIPSMIEGEHPAKKNDPSISFSKLAVSAFAPVSLLDSLSAEINPDYTSQEIDRNRNHESLTAAFKEVNHEISAFIPELEKAGENTILTFSISKFLAAFKLIKKMEIQERLLHPRKDKEKLKLLRNEIKSAYAALKQFYLKIKARLLDGEQSNGVINFFTNIKIWFPAFFASSKM